MQKKHKFILFTIEEFDRWLRENRFNRVINLIQNHHTYIPSYKHFKGNNHFTLLKSMEAAHIERGFAEIAQNITTFPDRSVAVCRPIDKIPAGIKGANTAGICIEHLGNFDHGGDNMAEIHRQTIVKINAFLCLKFGLRPNTNTIVYHHWYDLNTGKRLDGAGMTKSCPGTNFFSGNTVDAAKNNFIPLIYEVFLSLSSESPNIASLPMRIGEVIVPNLNIRTGASTSFPIIKTLTQGIMVNIYEEKNGWYKIHPGEQHWVFGRYLKVKTVSKAEIEELEDSRIKNYG